MPSVVRSSGTKPSPARRRRRTVWRVTSWPSKAMEPVVGGRSPRMTSLSSVWPLPWTPAMARISPARTCRSMSSRRVVPSSMRLMPSRASPSSPGSAGGLSTVRETSWPTMRPASSAAEAVGSAVPTTRPRRMTVMVSATSRISRSLWVMKTMEVPEALSSRMMVMSSSVSCGVSTAVGSSRMRTLASLARALMISTRCWTPTGRSSMRAWGSTSKPKRREISVTLAAAAPALRSPSGPAGS